MTSFVFNFLSSPADFFLCCATVDGSLLDQKGERVLLSMINDVWVTVEKCVQNYNTSAMCMYLFDLAKGFSSYYEAVSIKKEANVDVQVFFDNHLCCCVRFLIFSLSLFRHLGCNSSNRCLRC